MELSCAIMHRSCLTELSKQGAVSLAKENLKKERFILQGLENELLVCKKSSGLVFWGTTVLSSNREMTQVLTLWGCCCCSLLHI